MSQNLAAAILYRMPGWRFALPEEVDQFAHMAFKAQTLIREADQAEIFIEGLGTTLVQISGGRLPEGEWSNFLTWPIVSLQVETRSLRDSEAKIDQLVELIKTVIVPQCDRYSAAVAAGAVPPAKNSAAVAALGQ